MKKFKVYVERISTKFTTIEVEAENRDEATRLAYEKASDTFFENESDIEYKVMNVAEQKSQSQEIAEKALETLELVIKNGNKKELVRATEMVEEDGFTWDDVESEFHERWIHLLNSCYF